MEGLGSALLPAPGSWCPSQGAGLLCPPQTPPTSVFPPEFPLAHVVLGCLDVLGMVTQLFGCWIWDGGVNEPIW